jgi:hypothetical protein
LLAGAATANEGKIHLGYVYASDRSLATARTMIRGGLCFAPVVQSYLEASGPLATSRPFFYAVHRDSQVAADDVAAHLAATHELLIQSPDAANYFGVDLSVPPQRLTQAALEARFDPAHVSAAFDTPEIAIDSRAVAVAISRRIAEDPNIELRLGRTVTAVEGDEGRLSVRANGLYHADIDAFTCVVNALWDGRLAIDATRNIHPGRRWIHRFKHGIRFRLTEGAALPSVTIVLGPFGDVVDYGDGQFYISWYPACMLAHSDAVVPPAWNPEPEEPLRSQIVDETFLAIGAIVPQLLGVHPEAVDVKAGVIVAWGHTDIDDHASELHNRHAIGVHSYGNFHSIDPGKLTMAPYFAEICAGRILGATGS